MKAPANVDPEMLTVIEIMQHCAEILSRLPLKVLREHIGADDGNAWVKRARTAVLAAEAFDLAAAELSAEEARLGPQGWPDDALPSR